MGQEHHNSTPWLIGAASLLLISSMVFAVLALQNQQFDELVLKLDRYGFTSASKQEMARVATIDALDIPADKRLILQQRTIFLGATPQMVLLALGEPMAEMRLPKTAESAAGTIVMVYRFSEANRPTVLRFDQENLLQAAEKRSMYEVQQLKRFASN